MGMAEVPCFDAVASISPGSRDASGVISASEEAGSFVLRAVANRSQRLGKLGLTTNFPLAGVVVEIRGFGKNGLVLWPRVTFLRSTPRRGRAKLSRGKRKLGFGRAGEIHATRQERRETHPFPTAAKSGNPHRLGRTRLTHGLV